MKTKDLIALLQREDPTGEAHVRLDCGVPIAVIAKPGYWDGPYAYLDEDGNYVISALNNKIDIYTIDLEGYVSDLALDGMPWEEIKKKIKFEFSCYQPHSSSEKKNRYLKSAKKVFDEVKKID
jgi:hypothetical protein